MYSDEQLIMQLAGLPVAPRRDQGAAPSRHTWGLAGYPLASVYAPLQEWREVYDEEKGLARGTLFAELDKPFLGKGA